MSLLNKPVKRKNTSEDFNNSTLKWQSIFCPASPDRFHYWCAFLNGLHCKSQKDNLHSDLCCHDFCIKLSTVRIPLQRYVGFPEFYSRNLRERFLLMQHICQISDIPRLLQICCEFRDQLCSHHARDGCLLPSRQLLWSDPAASVAFPLLRMP